MNATAKTAVDASPPTPQALSVSDLTKRFGGNRVLRGVSFEVGRGDITGVIGPNGAGKTTCFNCISGELKADGGAIRFEQAKINGLPPNRLYKMGLHRTFQIPGPISSVSLVENVMLAYKNQTGERFWRPLLTPFRVGRAERRYFDASMETLRLLNLEKLAFEPARVLSGGQKKLLELARALVGEPKVILLDEPTAGVNPTLGLFIGEHIQRICEERDLTFLMISHDMSVVRRICKRVIVMANGATLTEGTPEQVSEDARVQQAYLGRTDN